jgi:hypothetical protein
VKASRAHLRREPREDLRRPAALEMGHRIYIVECRKAPASRPCSEPANGAATLAEMPARMMNTCLLGQPFIRYGAVPYGRNRRPEFTQTSVDI